jgi:hypothetical protein
MMEIGNTVVLTEIEEEFLSGRFSMTLKSWHITQLLRACLDLEGKNTFGIGTLSFAVENRLNVLSGNGWALVFLSTGLFDQW